MAAMAKRLLLALFFCGYVVGCAGHDDGDGPAATPTPAPTEFDVVASEPRFIIPGDTLPAEFQTFASNNNVESNRRPHTLREDEDQVVGEPPVP
jgi:hypothetical protein